MEFVEQWELTVEMKSEEHTHKPTLAVFKKWREKTHNILHRALALHVHKILWFCQKDEREKKANWKRSAMNINL